MSILGWIALGVATLVLWWLSGFVVKVVGFLARMFIRLVIVIILLGLVLHMYQRMTGRPVYTSVEWKNT